MVCLSWVFTFSPLLSKVRSPFSSSVVRARQCSFFSLPAVRHCLARFSRSPSVSSSLVCLSFFLSLHLLGRISGTKREAGRRRRRRSVLVCNVRRCIYTRLRLCLSLSVFFSRLFFLLVPHRSAISLKNKREYRPVTMRVYLHSLLFLHLLLRPRLSSKVDLHTHSLSSCSLPCMLLSFIVTISRRRKDVSYQPVGGAAAVSGAQIVFFHWGIEQRKEEEEEGAPERGEEEQRSFFLLSISSS